MFYTPFQLEMQYSIIVDKFLTQFRKYDYISDLLKTNMHTFKLSNYI